jgi:hypothetical protein
MSRTDLEFDPQWTRYIDYGSGTTAAFNVMVRPNPMSASRTAASGIRSRPDLTSVCPRTVSSMTVKLLQSE